MTGGDGSPLDDEQAINPSVKATPRRRDGSIRRTMSIDVRWPDGIRGEAHYRGYCRDALTRRSGVVPATLAEAMMDVSCRERRITAITATPTPPLLQELVGVSAGGHLRNALSSLFAEEKRSGSPLYLLLDDLAGATLVSGWAFSQWPDDDPAHASASVPDRDMTGVCIGLRRGSDALDAAGRVIPSQITRRVPPLAGEDDPAGWHTLPEYCGVHFRRARRIDMWRDGDSLQITSHFQDSARTSDGGDRVAIHEYFVEARIDGNGILKSASARPGTLPFPACHAAPANLAALLETPAGELRETVLDKLSMVRGCTHLNDAMRALAEVPALAEALDHEGTASTMRQVVTPS